MYAPVRQIARIGTFKPLGADPGGGGVHAGGVCTRLRARINPCTYPRKNKDYASVRVRACGRVRAGVYAGGCAWACARVRVRVICFLLRIKTLMRINKHSFPQLFIQTRIATS